MISKRHKFRRGLCAGCDKDVSNEISIGGQDGNQCITCFCDSAIIGEEQFLEAIKNRICYECGRILTIEPAIIEDKIEDFSKVLLCFRCRWGRDFNNDQERKRKFYIECQVHSKHREDVRSRNERQQAEWQNEYRVQREIQRRSNERRKKIGKAALIVATLSSIIAGFLIFNSTGKWGGGERIVAIFVGVVTSASAARYLVKEVLFDFFDIRPTSPIPSQPIEEPVPSAPRSPGNDALCSYPDLLFDGNEEAAMNKLFVHFYPLDPPDWKERSKKCRRRDKFTCAICGKKRTRAVLHSHHVIPKYEGGCHSLQNLITLCVECHEDQKYYGHDKLFKDSMSFLFGHPQKIAEQTEMGL